MKGGNERQEVVFKKYVGMGKIRVVAVNPPEVDKDGNYIDYVENVKRKFKGINETGEVEPIEQDVEEVAIVFKLLVEGTGLASMKALEEKMKANKTWEEGMKLDSIPDAVLKHTVKIYKQYNCSYKDFENTGKVKYQWINSTGNTAWAFDESELEDKFVAFLDKGKNVIEKKQYRKAYVGESELFTFLNAWIGNKIRKRFSTWDYEINVDKLFKGKFEQISSFVGGEFDGQFVGMFYVETSEDGEKTYQKLFGKAFLRDNFLKYINNGLTFPDKYAKDSWEYFTDKVESPTDIEHALKGFYIYSAIEEYDPTKDLAAKKETVTETDDKY